ncbi:MAG TPA: hypothetical protein VMS79_01745 [Methanomassiliicoccales archaeon]|jgi:hypothetical protein|nr:hypothetical protein [Methanomassiliicoccales archaeon]
MNFDFLIAGAIGLGPILFLMYYTLKSYTFPVVEKPFFDDRRIFLFLAIGLIVGVVVWFFEFGFYFGDVIVALAFAVIEELVRLVILNFKRFQRKLDTVFIGLVLGLGMGGAIATGNVFASLSSLAGLIGPADIAILILVSIQLGTLGGATGATIGAGVAKSLPFSYFAQAAMVHIAVNLIMIGFYLSGDLLIGSIFLVIATAIPAYYYWYVHTRLIPNLVKGEVKRYGKKAKKIKKVAQ